jgi:hypothetical protein
MRAVVDHFGGQCQMHGMALMVTVLYIHPELSQLLDRSQSFPFYIFTPLQEFSGTMAVLQAESTASSQRNQGESSPLSALCPLPSALVRGKATLSRHISLSAGKRPYITGK